VASHIPSSMKYTKMSMVKKSADMITTKWSTTFNQLTNKKNMRTALQVFSIIGIVFLGLALVGTFTPQYDLIYTFFLALMWLPLCVLTIVALGEKPKVKK